MSTCGRCDWPQSCWPSGWDVTRVIPAIRTMAGAVVGVGLSALIAGMEDPMRPTSSNIMDAGLARLEALPL